MLQEDHRDRSDPIDGALDSYAGIQLWEDRPSVRAERTRGRVCWRQQAGETARHHFEGKR